MTPPRPTRRQILRGAAGFSLALPLLPSLLPRTAGAGGGGSPRPRRFVALCTEHGGVWGANMFPGDEALTDTDDYAERTIRRGDLIGTIEGEQTRISPVLSAPADVLTPERVAALNVIRGVDATFYIGHHRGGHLGNYASNDGNSADGRVMWERPCPTIDQVMAWSEHVYPDLSSTLERSMIVGNGISHGWSSPATQSGLVQPMPGAVSSLALFNRIFVPEEDELGPRPPVVDRVIDSYRSLRQSNRRLSAGDRQRLDEHIERLDELQRRLAVRVSCGDIPTPTTDSQQVQLDSGYPFDPQAQAQSWQLFNDVIATAFICDTSRIAVLRITDHFSDYAGEWHEHIAHKAHLPDYSAQQVLADAHQRVFSDVFMDLVRKLDVDQGDGTTLLDDSLVAWTQESGNLTHESLSVPIVTAGSAGGTMRTGQYVDYRDLDRVLTEANTDETMSPGLSYNQWLGTALQAMGLPRAAYESGEHGGYGEHLVGEGRGDLYPSAVGQVQGQWLPWLSA